MTDEESLASIEQEQLAALDEIASIKEQIGRAKGLAVSEGKYSDSDWFHRANRALRHKQIDHQKLLMKAAELRKKIRKKSRNDFESAFVDAAFATLDKPTYHAIVVQAIAMSKANQ